MNHRSVTPAPLISGTIRSRGPAAAAPAARDPLRISFASALDTVRGPVGDLAAFPP
jgi:hypothetical protein